MNVLKAELNLRNCPFCSGNARIVAEDGQTEPKRCYIRCSVCGARTETMTADTPANNYEKSTDDDAIKAAVERWNMRAERK